MSWLVYTNHDSFSGIPHAAALKNIGALLARSKVGLDIEENVIVSATLSKHLMIEIWCGFC